MKIVTIPHLCLDDVKPGHYEVVSEWEVVDGKFIERTLYQFLHLPDCPSFKEIVL